MFGNSGNEDIKRIYNDATRKLDVLKTYINSYRRKLNDIEQHSAEADGADYEVKKQRELRLKQNAIGLAEATAHDCAKLSLSVLLSIHVYKDKKTHALNERVKTENMSKVDYFNELCRIQVGSTADLEDYHEKLEEKLADVDVLAKSMGIEKTSIYWKDKITRIEEKAKQEEKGLNQKKIKKVKKIKRQTT
jgi:hypothetical protein